VTQDERAGTHDESYTGGAGGYAGFDSGYEDDHGSGHPSGYDHEGYDEDGYHDEGYHDDGWDEGEARHYGHDHRGHAAGGAHHSRRRRRHPVLMALGIVVAALVILVGGGLWWAQKQIDPGGKPGAAVTVVIPTGASTSKIASVLASAGVIHDAFLFRLWAKLHGAGPLYPGTYKLDKNSSYQSAVSALEKGPPIVTQRLVIPEGYTLRQIAAAVAALPNMGLSASKFVAAATDGTVRSPYEPNGVNNLEGLLFPATYIVRQGESEVDVLQTLVQTFDDRAASLGLAAAAAKRHETPYQLVTVASIVQREAKFVADYGPVASALYNRLQAGMTLGADSTQTYYMRLARPSVVPTVAQLNEPSPYNTRLNKGLPPTPIANPGIPALQAAATPPTTTYLYFVEVNANGKLGFASTATGFASLQAQCHAAGLC
jgi:UPF0755 protein